MDLTFYKIEYFSLYKTKINKIVLILSSPKRKKRSFSNAISSKISFSSTSYTYVFFIFFYYLKKKEKINIFFINMRRTKYIFT